MTSRIEPVYIAGVGANTALGQTAPSSAAAVRAGVVRFAPHPRVIDRAGNPIVVARAPHLDDNRPFAERCFGLLLPAALEALALPLKAEPGGIDLILGVPPERIGWPASLSARLAEHLAEHLTARAMTRRIEVVRSGAGLMAVERAWRRVRDGSVEWCLVGCVDSYLRPETLEWFDEQGLVHSYQSPWGFVPGEGAGFCLLGSRRALYRWGIRPLAEVVRVAAAHDVEATRTNGVSTGRGLTEATRQVLAGVPDHERIPDIFCDLNGDPYRADEMGFTLTRLTERFAHPRALITPAECWGEVGAAAGPLMGALAVAAFMRGYARGAYALLSTSAGAEDGDRCVAVLGARI